jgi:GT2 family glycosyltransferase
VTFVSLALAFLRRDVLEGVGLLNEDFFFGAEEWDYSLRVRRAGYDLVFDPEVRAMHTGGGSHSNSDPMWIYNGYRNKIAFQYRYLSRPLFALWLIIFHFYTAVVGPLVVPRLHKTAPSRRALRRSGMQAIRDFHRYGPRVELTHLEEFRRLTPPGLVRRPP